MIDGEDVWVNYDIEDAKVKIDLADLLLEHLIEEVIYTQYKKSNEEY